MGKGENIYHWKAEGMYFHFCVESFIIKIDKVKSYKGHFKEVYNRKIIFLADPPTCNSPVGNPLPPSAMPAPAASIRPRAHPDRVQPQRFTSCGNLHRQLSFIGLN